MLVDDDNRPIKRAPVVYGKRSSNNPPRSPVVSPDEQAQPFERAHHSPTVPSQPPRPAHSLNASDTERSPGPGADAPFTFDFRHRLRELDEQFEHRDVQSQRGSPSDNKVVHADLSEVERLQSVPMGTTSEMPHASGELSRSLSPPLSSLPTTFTQEYPPDSLPVHQRARRVQNTTLSDSEAEEPSRSSSVSPLRHVITTPHSRSSPTPPTSGEITMPSRKAKGKAPAHDVLPLFFDSEGPSPAETSKLKKGRRSESLVRPKIKAPTKKERREATFESSRIAASRPVEVRRTQEQKYSLSTFFTNLRRDNIVTPGALGTELPSDPIERFSSPTDKSTLVEPESNAFGRPMGPLATSVDMGRIGQSSLTGGSKALPPAAADSDDEMPSIASMIQQADGKRQRLHAIKQAALQHADTNKDVDDHSEDDGLLIVKDDMHSVARQEAVQRRLDKAHGSPVKGRDSLRRLNHPSVRPAPVSPRKLSKQELQELAKPSFVRAGKRAKGQLNKNQLDQLMMMRHGEEQLKSIKRQEEEWVKRGGKLSRDTGGDDARNSLSQTVEAYAAEGLKAVAVVGVAEEEAGSDESDEDYIPNTRSASPEPAEQSDMQDDNIIMDVSSIPQPPGHQDHDEEDEINALRRHKYSQRRPRVVVGSDDEGMQPGQHNLPAAQRDSASSMESQTEDENDKENKAIVHHEPSSPEVKFGVRLGSLHDIEDGAEKSLSLAPATNPNDTVGSLNGDVRSPLRDISKDENDLFLSPPSKSLFTNHLLSATRSPPRASTSTRSLGLSPTLRSERINRVARFSLDSRNDENDPPGFTVPHPSFLERLQSQSSPEPSLPCLNPLACGGFSQLFSAEEQGSKESGDTTLDELALTLDVGLKPALEVGNTLRRKAETIFEKEQEYVVAAMVQQNDRPKEVLYINDHGFLTQTRPEGSSPQIYRTTPSQATRFTGTQVQSPQTQSLGIRPPLRTLSFTASRETSPEPQPLRRLRRRSLSPLEHKITGENGNRLNAFTILGKTRNSLSKEQDKKHEKSEFVAVEAEESDEDDMFGFGGPKGDDEKEDDNEQDKVVQGLVDDTVMDAEMAAVDLVQEKFREHVEEDDQRLQKLHEDATKGKFRIKRRNRAVGFEDDSDEDDDDDDERRIRRRMSKKRRKIEDDNLEVLGQNEETRAFYDTYHQDLIDMDDEFGYLRGDAAMFLDNDDSQFEEPEETVSMDEIRRRVREVAENNYEVEVLDPEDTSWVDRAMNMEADDTVPVKTVECRRAKPVVRRANAVEFDEERSARRASEEERKQMASWAKNQSRGHQGTARSGNTTAITGHARAKSGGGSLRLAQSSKLPTLNATRTTKTASLLSMVSNRSGRFS